MHQAWAYPLLLAWATAPAAAFALHSPALAADIRGVAPGRPHLGIHRRAPPARPSMMAVPPRPLNPNVPEGSAAARLRLLLAKPGLLYVCVHRCPVAVSVDILRLNLPAGSMPRRTTNI